MKKFLGFVGVLVFGTEAGETAVINVPGGYATIQAMVNVANSGDTICVFTGTCNEAVYINKGIEKRWG